MSAVSFGGEIEELHQELLATQAKLRKMEAQMAAANKRLEEASASRRHQTPGNLAEDSINPLVTPPPKGAMGYAGTHIQWRRPEQLV
jgi:hypothetical protein